MATTINPSDQTITQYNIQTGGANNLLNNVAPSATSGVPVISQGASSQPIFGTAVVAGGGTGVATMTAYALVCGGTTTTGAVQNVADVATGQVLVSGGVSALPAFSASPTVTSITFGSGTALSNYAEGTYTPTMIGGSTAGSTVYTTQNGFYTRVGNIVLVFAIAAGSSATGTGSITYAGLPFTVKNQTGNCYGAIQFFNARTWPASRTDINFLANTNSTQGTAQTQGSGQGQSPVQMANISFNDQYTDTYQI